jgi:hypothetical protein
MRYRQNFLRAFAFTLSLFVFSIVVPAQTETRRTQFSLYGMQAVASGQSLQLTVVNPRLSEAEIVPCIKVRIVFDVYAAADAATGKLRFVRRVAHEVELDRGEAAVFDYAASRSGEYVSAMVFARPEETSTETAGARILSMLLLREGGRTLLNLPADIKGFDPQPDPPQTISAAEPLKASPVPK